MYDTPVYHTLGSINLIEYNRRGVFKINVCCETDLSNIIVV